MTPDGAQAEGVSPSTPLAWDITDAQVILANAVAQRLDGLGTQFPGALAGMEIHRDQKGIDVYYDADSPLSSAFVASASRMATPSVGTVLIPADVSLEDFQGASTLLLGGEGQALLGQEVSYVSYTPSGGIKVVVEDVDLAKTSMSLQVQARMGGVELPKFDLVAGPGPRDAVETYSSTLDSSPWRGGGLIRPGTQSAPNWCTSGFVWDKWTTRELMGSSAEHCHWELGATTWRTGGASAVNFADLVEGSRYFYDVDADTMLFRARPGTAFRPYDWVAGSASPRKVTGYVLTTAVSSVVALSGATSGYHSTTVKDYVSLPLFDRQGHRVINEDGNPATVFAARTYSDKCEPGDSGGPWLSANSDLAIRAHGQEHGETFVDAEKKISNGCVFVQAGTISKALSASIAVSN